jgi:FMN reductase
MSRRIVAVTAGLTVPSSTRLLADQLAEATTAQVTARGESAEIDFIELREVAGELATFMVTGGIPTPRLTELREQVAAADGLIVVTPVFNGSYSGLFKMFFDALDKDALVGTPVLMGATAGTARHSLALEHALRPLFAYLRATVVPTAVFAAADDWAGGTEAGAGLADRVDRAAGELADLVAGRPPAAPVDPFADPTTSFEDLLRGR